MLNKIAMGALVIMMLVGFSQMFLLMRDMSHSVGIMAENVTTMSKTMTTLNQSIASMDRHMTSIDQNIVKIQQDIHTLIVTIHQGSEQIKRMNPMHLFNPN